MVHDGERRARHHSPGLIEIKQGHLSQEEVPSPPRQDGAIGVAPGMEPTSVDREHEKQHHENAGANDKRRINLVAHGVGCKRQPIAIRCAYFT